MQHLLSYLIFLPFGVGIVALLIPAAKKQIFRWVTVAVGIAQCIILVLIHQTYTHKGGFQLTEKLTWIKFDIESIGTFQADYFVGLDGLSLTLVSLSVIILLIASVASWNINKDVKGYFILLLILNSAILGSFCALDLLLFYVFFEFMLLPMYFLIGIWGGPKREYASIKFFLYTLLGSVLILLVLFALYLSVKDPSSSPENLVHSFNMVYMTDQSNFIPGSVLDPASVWTFASWSARTWAFLLLFIGFGIKLPMVPLHTWLPDAHVEAPTAISVILAALLLKIGAYGLLRLAYPVFPLEAWYASWFVALTGMVSIVYGALNALASKDFKKLIAYSSVSHMGFVLLGIASGTTEGTTGAVFQLFSHGILTAMLFILAGVLSDRTGDRIIENYSGLASTMKSFTVFIMIAFFASMGLPAFSGFIGEVLILLGAFASSSSNGLVPKWMAMVSTLGLVLSAGYFLWTIQRMFLGSFVLKKIPGASIDDLTGREYLILLPLALLTLFFGIFPQPLLDIIQPFSDGLVELLVKSKP